jgi:hypothetical protein
MKCWNSALIGEASATMLGPSTLSGAAPDMANDPCRFRAAVHANPPRKQFITAFALIGNRID